MILYACASPEQLGPILLHRLTVNEKKEAILLFDKERFSKTNLDNLENIIFTKIVTADFFTGAKCGDKEESEIEKQILNEFDSRIRTCGYDICDFNEIYLTCDWMHAEFPTYLSLLNIPYFLLETYENLSSNQKTFPYENKMKNAKNFKTWISEEYGNIVKRHLSVTPDAKNAMPILLEKSSRSHRKYVSKDFSLWSIEEAVIKLNPKYISLITDLFDVPKNIDEDSILFISMSDNWPYNQIMREEHPKGLFVGWERWLLNVYANQIALDFFVPEGEKVYMKLHPTTGLNYYLLPSFSIVMDNDFLEKYYGKNVVNLGTCPMEFLGKYLLSNEIRFKSLLAFHSGANDVASIVCNESLVLTRNYWRCFYLYPKLYITMFLAKTLGEEINYIFSSNTYYEQIVAIEEQLVNTNKKISWLVEDEEMQKKSFGIVDVENDLKRLKKILNKLTKDSAVVILNAKENNEFYEAKIEEFLVPLVIKKEKIKMDTIDPCANEVLWIFSKSEKIREIISDFKIEKVLPRLGVKFFIE